MTGSLDPLARDRPHIHIANRAARRPKTLFASVYV